MSRSVRRTPEPKVRRVNIKQRPVDWRDLVNEADLSDVPDLFGGES